MGEIIYAVFGGIFLILLSLLGIEKGKASKERKAKEKAESERDTLQLVSKVQEVADQIKDELAVKGRENQAAKEEVIQSIDSIPEEKEVPLSEDVKKLAADQSARLRSRAGRVSD